MSIRKFGMAGLMAFVAGVLSSAALLTPQLPQQVRVQHERKESRNSKKRKTRGGRNKYWNHPGNGPQECARRVRQMQNNLIPVDQIRRGVV